MDRISFLKSVNIFSTLVETEREILASRFKEIQFGAGDNIISEGDPSQCLYLICSGFVDVTRGPKENRIFLTTLTAGEYFGEAALFQDLKRTANVDARDNVQLLMMDRQNFAEYLGAYPSSANQILLQMLKQIFVRLSQTSHELQFERKDSLAQSAIDKLFT